ncbi:hypothetical protein FAES_1970 [Fibrella aestuarina BUZ 2]|uniref:Right handed beta helix domain-containing protein n=1 Tax=Fibrella aestuarina BUZ 2 TaxID=1166018 RepID=I0K776_9BACT|nr:hypothetical protein [Fibrella aestuarina]CCG99979.1 hypothetical protein FAES_1970 [Fibrella aestuarina BUZ 2]
MRYLLLLCYLLVAPASPPPPVVYVTPFGSGDESGTSWKNALSGLRLTSTLINARPGTQFWLAEGTYHPTVTNDRNASFILASGVQLYGGFAGTETTLSGRVPGTHETILSGNIGDETSSTDNSFHVVQIIDNQQPILLDNLTIRDGRIQSYDDGNFGGAGLSIEATLSLSTVQLSRCRFIDNKIHRGLTVGGAVSLLTETNARSTLTIRDCYFSGNEAGYGGAIGLSTQGGTFNTVITNSTFDQNTGKEGGAVSSRFVEHSPDNLLSISKCTFSRNVAEATGGGITTGGGVEKLEACTFIGNKVVSTTGASSGGGAVFCFNNSPTFQNCLFASNRADEGGAIQSLSDERPSAPTFINCTFADNSASVGGGVMNARLSRHEFQSTAHQVSPTKAFFINCISWGNLAPDAPFFKAQTLGDKQADATVTHSIIEGDFPGEGNRAVDPLFVDATSGDYRLRPDSPALFKGSVRAFDLPASDLAGYVRQPGQPVSLGAFEYVTTVSSLAAPITVQRRSLVE